MPHKVRVFVNGTSVQKQAASGIHADIDNRLIAAIFLLDP